jgi:hypothetical protein
MGSILGWILAAAASVGGGLVIVPRRRQLRHRIVGRVDQSLRRKVSRFDRRYREFVLSSLRFVDLKGLATVGFYTPELDDVFVEVSLAYRAPHLVADDIVGHPPAVSGERTSLVELLDRQEPVVLAVIGVPGSGKSTLLRYTARMMCRNPRKRRRSVPILLYLRDHVAAVVENPDLTLAALVRGALGRYTEPAGWLEQRLRDGDCVVLLDGLDEVAEQADRRRVATWVERQTKQYPRNDFVITSRPQGYRSAGIDGAVVLQVRGFSDKQVSHFVRAWYLAVEQHGAPAAGEDVRSRAEAAAADLLSRLNAAPALYDLTVNPLLLTMIANVHRYRGALPGGRVDLYREICEVVLWRRREAKNLDVPLTGDKREALLRGLAFTMMKSRVRDLPRAKVLTHIRPALRRMTQDVTAENFLADESRDGLFVERENGEYSFAHHTFQEYLAAAHILDKGSAKLLCDSVDDPWWRETTLLYAARSDADAIVRACLTSDSVTALSLAFDCAGQCRELALELRKELDGLLESALGPDGSPQRRRLMVSVQLTRHLARLVRCSGNTRVCLNPITSAIYQLYLEDINAAAAQLPGTKPEDPIAGVSAADAADFIRWVNSTIGQAGYRLPSHDEVTDSAVQRTLGTLTRSVWFQPNGEVGPSSLWTPPGQPHPHLIEPGTVAGHLAMDFQYVAPTLGRILHLRSIAAAQHIAVDPDHGLSRAKAIVYELGVAHQLSGRSNVSRDFLASEALADDLIHNLGRDHALARASARDLEATLRRIVALDRTDAHSRPLDRALALDDDHDFVPAAALVAAIDRVLETKPSPPDWLGMLANAFSDRVMASFTEYLIAPESIPNLVGTACERFKDADFPGSPGFQRWCREVPDRFLRIATFPTVHQPRTTHAAAIRLSALCFVDISSNSEELAEMFRKIAAGITLVERRVMGLAPVTETIILATA